MTTAQLVFLYAAEERSISKAAKRAYVSQQCASNHIKNLEAQYGVALFNRKPSLSLTTAGECLRQSLQQIFLIEQNASVSMEEISKGGVGSLSIGVNATRGRILFPTVLKQFSKEFPRVEVSMQFDDTIKNLQLLAQGKEDMVIGIGAQTSDFSQFRVIPLSRDRVFFLSSELLIMQYCPDFFDNLSQKGEISLHSLLAFPFCRNSDGSTLTRLVDSHLFHENITLNTRYNVSDYDAQIEFCASHLAAAFCPSMMLHRVAAHNLISPDDKLLFFPISEINEELRIDLFQNEYVYQPLYVKRFIQILKDTIANSQAEEVF